MNDQPVRLPPHDIDTERCALGCAMLDADAAAQVIETLAEADYFRPAHQIAHRAIRDLLDAGAAVNAVSVATQIRRYPEHGPDGLDLFKMIEQVPVVAQVGYFINTIRAYAALRRLTEVGPAITALGYRSAPDDAALAVESAQAVFDDATRALVQSKGQYADEMITSFLDGLEHPVDDGGVTTGLTDLDALVTKLRPGQLITIGARPGVGKTALMAGLAHHVGVKLGQPVYVATLEMSTKEFLSRIVSLDCKVSIAHLIEPKQLTQDDWKRLAGAYTRVTEAGRILIDDDPALGIAQIRAGIRAMRRSGNAPALVVIDYLQLMRMPGRSENRSVEVGQVSRALKLLAKEFAVPVVIGSQLNREVEKRTDKRPTIADLRESGAVEQDSDMVILLHRPEVYEQETPRAGEIDLIVDKNRAGPRGTVTCTFQGPYSRIVNAAWTPYKGPQ